MTDAISGATDADLVTRVLQADRDAFAVVYDRYGPKLYDFAYSMLRHPEDAADTVADSFVLFAERLPQLRDPDRLRPWLYAITRSECLRRLKARKRVSYGDDEQLMAVADDAKTPEEEAETAALRQLVWDAAAGLADRDRALLDLHLRQGLDGAELGEAMGVSPSNVYVMVNRLKSQVDKSLGALLIARMGREECETLDDLLVKWDGSFNPLIRKRVARHVEKCEICGERRSRMLSPWALLAAVPVFVAPAALRDRVLTDTQLVAFSGLDDSFLDGVFGDDEADAEVMADPEVAAEAELDEEVAAEAEPEPAPAPEPEDDDEAAAVLAPAGSETTAGGLGRRRRFAAAALAALVLIGGGAAVLWPDDDKDPELAVATPTPTPTGPDAPTLTAQPSEPTTSAAPTPSESPTESPSESPSATPGKLTVSTRSIDLGLAKGTKSFRVTNAGGSPVKFSASADSGWLTPGQTGGTLAPGASQTIAVGARRSGLGEGVHFGNLRLSWADGNASVQVRVRQENDPVVGAPRMSTNPSCQVQVVASATDESPLSWVRLSWSGPSGSGSVAMTRVGSGWRATAGDFTVGGNVTFVVTAHDSRGNTESGPPVTRNVNPCPG